jgi:isopentenyldiphosphate isomerase
VNDEMLDIYDESGQHTGAAPRGEVHRCGHWHRTFHCWIYRRDGQRVFLLFQKRHPAKDTSPDKLDITSAGHLLAGEEPRDGVRELEEELGLSVPYERLHPIGMVRDVSVEPGIVDKELCHVYAYECNQPLERYRIQQEELTGLFWVELEEAVRLFRGEIPAVRAEGLRWRADGTASRIVLEAHKADFVAHEESYYRTVFAAVKRLAAGAEDGAF